VSLKYKVISSRVISSLLALSLSFGLFGCDSIKLPQSIKNVGFDVSGGNLAEVAPPQTLVKLDQLLESSQPQVSIISPRSQTTLQNVNVVVDLELKGYPLFKDKDLKLGPHLSLILDNEPYQDIYDLAKPIMLENLKPGTHHLAVLVEKPWSESFKNPEAFAQTTFNILTETEDDSSLPSLIYNQPNGVYQAEPVLLDFYVAGMKPGTWQVRATINDEKFLLEQMQPTYLKGFSEGNNLVQLELLDRKGKAIKGKSNQPIRLITYEPNTSSSPNTLSKLVNGQLSFDESVLIADQNYRNVPETALDEEKSIDAPEDFETEDLDKVVSNEETVSSPRKSSTESESVIFDQDEKLGDSNLNSQKSIVDENLSRAASSGEAQKDKGLSSLLEEESSEVERVGIAEPEASKVSKKEQIRKTEVNNNSVPTNSVSEKIRALTESRSEPLGGISPLPTEVETSPKIKPLELKSQAENSSQEKLSQTKSIDASQSSLNESRKIAIANEIPSKQDFRSVDQPNMIDSSDSNLDITNRVNDESANDEVSKPNPVPFPKTKSRINSILAVWLPKISGVLQQLSQQALSLIHKSVTALRANFSAS